MQRDPVGYWDSMNLYQYTGNSPINFVDPLGLYWLKDWSDLSAGFGDTITFGITDWLRYKWNYGGSVDPCSGWYKGGQYTAYAAEIAVGAAEGIAIRNAAKKGAKKLWPKTAKEMDELLGIEGKRIPDGPLSPGRNKTVWEPSDNVRITHEKHPYHNTQHIDEHWHLDTPGPGNKHQTFNPGDRIPGY